MKIVFISHYFPPEVNAPASRTYEHCRRWVRSGHDVCVVTGQPNHPTGRIFPGYRNRILKRETVDGIKVMRLWTFLAANQGFALRSLNYLSLMVSVILQCWRLPKSDVVVSTSPQFFCGLAGYFVSRLRRLPWILEIRDIWPESIVTVGAMKKSMLIRLLEWLERFAYRKCDRIVVVTDSFKENIVGKGIAADKIEVIKNGADLELFTQQSQTDQAADWPLPEWPGKFVAAYVGTHGMAHHLETVLEAAALCQDPDILFLMVGGGADRARLVAKRDAMALENLVMVDQLSKQLMPELWRRVDVSLVLLRDSPLFTTVIPSKIFESMAMGRPVVLGVRGEAQRLVEGHECGVAITPEDAQALVAALVRLKQDGALYARLADNGQREVRTHFDRDLLANRYLEMMADVARAAGKPVSATVNKVTLEGHR